jgi:hypothetical protein
MHLSVQAIPAGWFANASQRPAAVQPPLPAVPDFPSGANASLEGRLSTAKVNAPTSDTPVYIQMGNA